MLKSALKWIILTFLIGVIIVCGIFFFIFRLSFLPRSSADVQSLSLPDNTPEATLSLPDPTATPSPVPTATPTPEPAVLLDRYINSMSTEEKVGQLVMFGINGTSAPSDAYKTLLEKYKIGNVILLTANIRKSDSDGGFNRASLLIQEIEKASGSAIPMLIGVDAEGGNVVRFSWSPALDSARELGKSNDPSAASAQFSRIGSALMECGININFAPVLDVSEKPASTYLDTRIISSDAEITAALGVASMEGLHSSGCLATAKHFPGHGGTTQDSHSTTPKIKKTLEQMEAYDLVPFQAAIDAGIDAVMIAHILYPELDAENIATLSPFIINELLREQMGFNGLVISDDVRMAALTSQASYADAAVRFILAGGDIILCGPKPDAHAEIMEALLAAVSDGTISSERLDESMRRILTAKDGMGGWTYLAIGE